MGMLEGSWKKNLSAELQSTGRNEGEHSQYRQASEGGTDDPEDHPGFGLTPAGRIHPALAHLAKVVYPHDPRGDPDQSDQRTNRQGQGNAQDAECQDVAASVRRVMRASPPPAPKFQVVIVVVIVIDIILIVETRPGTAHTFILRR